MHHDTFLHATGRGGLSPLALVVVAALVCGAFCGCGGAKGIAPAGGRVTLDGKPLVTGAVMFSPVAREGQTTAGRSAYGEIQPDGIFVLGTHEKNDGAVVGLHRVVVYGTPPDDKPAVVPPGHEQSKTSPQAKPRAPFDFMRLPGQQFAVVEGGENREGGENFFEIKLTSQQVQMYAQRDD